MRKNNVHGEIETQFKFDDSMKVIVALHSGQIIVSSGDGNAECISDDFLKREFCFDEKNNTYIIHTTSNQLVSASRDSCHATSPTMEFQLF